MNPDFVVVLVTASSEKEAQRIADALVTERLAACCNLVHPLRSTFRWKGETCHEEEALLLIKTRATLFESLAKRVRQLHSYETPEIIALPILCGDADYLGWIAEETTRPAGEVA